MEIWYFQFKEPVRFWPKLFWRTLYGISSLWSAGWSKRRGGILVTDKYENKKKSVFHCVSVCRTPVHEGMLSRVLFFADPWPVATSLLCPWDFSGKSTGVGCHFLLHGIFPTQGLNLSPALAGRFFTTEPCGKPGVYNIHTYIYTYTHTHKLIKSPYLFLYTYTVIFTIKIIVLFCY